MSVFIWLDIGVVGVSFHFFFFIEEFIDIDALANDGFKDFEFVLEADFLVFYFLLDQHVLFG